MCCRLCSCFPLQKYWALHGPSLLVTLGHTLPRRYSSHLYAVASASLSSFVPHASVLVTASWRKGGAVVPVASPTGHDRQPEVFRIALAAWQQALADSATHPASLHTVAPCILINKQYSMLSTRVAWICSLRSRRHWHTQSLPDFWTRKPAALQPVCLPIWQRPMVPQLCQINDRYQAGRARCRRCQAG